MIDLLTAVLIAAATPATQGQSDVIFKAMSDELQRSMTKLQLPGHPKPYYVSYMVKDHDARTVSASFGALTDRSKSHTRTLACDVRIGDYKQDSSSSMGGRLNLFAGLFDESTSLTVDDNYNALRRELWLQTDSAYKSAIERLKATETYLKQNTVEDLPDSFSVEKPAVHSEPSTQLTIDLDKWAEELRKVSAIFKEYSHISNSRADMIAVSENRWYLNNEGFKYNTGETGYLTYMSAQMQAPDGMRLTDEEMDPAWQEGDLPTQAKLESTARSLSERLARVAAAPLVSNYRGPVLFEGQAGAEFFHQLLDSKLVVSGSSKSLFRSSSGMQEKLGQRLLPKFISVVDDPQAKEWKGIKLFGNYSVDDNGIEGQKLTLIEKGILKTLCNGRTPTREIKQSNGHFRNGSAITSNVFIQSENKLSQAALKEKLIELGKEDGLDEVYIVRKILSRPIDLGGSTLQSLMSSISSGGAETALYPPVLLYKVSTKDGHEELCRGGSFANLTMRVLRDIEATGDDETAYATIGASNDIASIIAPSVLVKEIEIQRPDRTNSKGPVLKNPFFDKN